jgi:hypothetical protein
MTGLSQYIRRALRSAQHRFPNGVMARKFQPIPIVVDTRPGLSALLDQCKITARDIIAIILSHSGHLSTTRHLARLARS